MRPSHTYDDAHPPLPGDWTAWDRVVRGEEIVVPGDGTSLWTLTHAEDLAVGLVGLVGNWQSIGEDFHITSDEVLTWNEIYEIIGHPPRCRRGCSTFPSEFLSALAPDWFWSELILGDLAAQRRVRQRQDPAIRAVVPADLTWSIGARRLAQWRAANPDRSRPDPQTDAMLARLVEGSPARDRRRRAARPVSVQPAGQRVPSEPNPGARLRLEVSAEHCEGVVWDARTEQSRFIDIPRGRVFETDADAAEVSFFELPAPVTVTVVHPSTNPGTSTEGLSPAELTSQADARGIFRVRPGYWGSPR